MNPDGTPTTSPVPLSFSQGSNAAGVNQSAPNSSPQQQASVQNVSADVNPTTDTQALTSGPTTNSDVSNLIQQNVNQQDQLIANAQAAFQDPSYLNAQANALQAQQAVSDFSTAQQGGQANILAQNEPLEFQQGQAAALTRDSAYQASALANQANYYNNVLQTAQTSRQQKLDATQWMFTANNQQFNNLLNAYTSTAPTNIATNYNPYTGDVTTTMRNPVSGQTYNVVAGNIGKQQAYTSASSVQSILGVPTFVGVAPDGTITKTPLADFVPGATDSPTTTQEPTYTPNGSPVSGVSDAQSSLGYWVNGQTGSPPSPSYQQAVYDTFGKLTGQTINASTPASVLAANIPAYAQGIAVAEGWNDPNSSQHTLNNPGNIEWAGQANATPQTIQTSKGPRTFANFDTEQDGWNAEYDLLAKDLGATQTSSGNSDSLNNNSGVAAEIKTLAATAPQLFGAQGQNIKQTYDGHYYLDTTIPSADPNSAAALVNANGGGQIAVLDPSVIPQVRQVSLTQQKLGDLSQLIDQLPTSGTDPQRLLNVIAGNLGAQVGSTPADTVAAINNSWQTLIGEVNSIIPGSTGARLATSPLISGSNITASTIQSVAKTVIAQNQATLSYIENNIFGSPPQLDPNDVANQILGSQTTDDSSSLDAAWNATFGGQ